MTENKKRECREAERPSRSQEAVERLGAELAAADGTAVWADLLPYEKEHYLGAAIELIREEQAGERHVWGRDSVAEELPRLSEAARKR